MLLCKTLYFSILVFISIAYVAQTRRVIRAAPGAETTGNYIVVLKENTTHNRFEAIVDEVRNKSVDSKIFEKVESPIAKVVAANISEQSAHEIKLIEDVEFVEEETYAYGSISWALDRIDQVSPTLNGVYNPCGTGVGVDVYILDSGINYDHCDFGGRAIYPGFDPVDSYESTNLKGVDCHGHGSHTASIAVGTKYGVAKNATVYSVRVLRCNNAAPWSVVIDGLSKTASHIKSKNPFRPSVISMSLGGSFSLATDTAVTNAINQNIAVIAAAGNDRSDSCENTPASNAGVITVAGSYLNDHVYYYTNGGTCVDLFAPGQSVIGALDTCDLCTSTCSITRTGTSMATPIVAGAAALLLERNSSLTPADIKKTLISNSLKNYLNYNSLASSLRFTTPNRLVHIKQCNEECNSNYTTTLTSSHTITRTSTVTSATTVTNQVTSTVTNRVTSTVTNQVTSTVTNQVTSTVTRLVPTSTVTLVTTTPTPTEICCQTLKNFEGLEKNMMDNVGLIINNGINSIADLIKGNGSITINTRIPIQPSVTKSHITSPIISSSHITSTPVSSPTPTPSTCAELLQQGNLQSGYYLLQTDNGNKTVYCELEKEIKGNKGFLRVANINMSVPGTECPAGLSLRQDGTLKTCQRGQTAPGCTSTYFNSSGMEYSKVCGRVRGYQWASPNAFYWYTHTYGAKTIDDVYVDGVVLTYQNSSTGSREHIWTFAGAIDEIGRTISFACQCTNKDVTISNFKTPPFVGEDYFCETGSRNTFSYGTLYTNDPLWDGAGCGEMDTCCQRGQWFCKDVPTTSSDIELRLCGNEARSNEDTPLEIIELYIK